MLAQLRDYHKISNKDHSLYSLFQYSLPRLAIVYVVSIVSGVIQYMYGETI